MPLNQVLVGHCIEVMKRFPAESIDMVMFSPPYWGLRDYGEGTETVWGGIQDCRHEWVEEVCGLVHENRNNLRGSQEEVLGKTGTAWIRKYGQKTMGLCVNCRAWRGQLGLEPNYQMYIDHMVEVCKEIQRVLKKTGNMYIVLGDTFMHKRKLGIPWRVRLALNEDGWISRGDIVWHKPNHMPSSVKDRYTNSYEFIFFFTKSRRYYFDLDAIRIQPRSPIVWSRKGSSKEPWKNNNPRTRWGLTRKELKNLTKHDLAVNRVGTFSYSDPLHTKAYNIKGRNPGDYWSISTKPFKGAHFAAYPQEICVKPILSSCPPNGIVLDPMCGSGTTLVVAKKLGRKYIGIDINPNFVDIAKKRLLQESSALMYGLHCVLKPNSSNFFQAF